MLRTVIGRLRRPETRFLALSGEPGIGKTRLLEELARRGENAGHLVLAGRAAELERDLSFGLWVDALDDHAAWLGRDRLERMLGEHLAELAQVLPSAGRGAGGGALASPAERYRAHRAVRDLLRGIAAPRPLLVLLDDVQWADGASLELLAYLLRRPPQESILIGLATRAGAMPGALLAGLAAAQREGRVVDLRLGPLTAPEVDGLLGAAYDAPAREALLRLSGGNPFYLLQLARSAIEPGPASDHPRPDDVEVPPAVGHALRQEIDALGDPARQLARGAAVAGEPVELGIAAAAADLDGDVALSALDELVSLGLLRSAGAGRQYRFRHPIVRRAVYDSAGEGWRIAAHARAADALAASGHSPSTRAHHVERCAEPGDQAAVALLVETGHATAANAPASAAHWYAAALRLLPAGAEQDQRRLELLLGLATCLAAVGRLEEALAALADLLPRLPASAAELRVRVVAACATLENLLGRHRAAHDRLLRALDELAEPRSAAAGVLQVELAADALFDSDFEAMADWATAAGATGRALGDPAMTAVAAGLLCFAGYGRGDLDAAEQARAEAAAVDDLPDARVATSVEALYYLGFAEFFCERYDDAIRHLRRGIAVARAFGQGQLVIPMLVGLAHSLEVRGLLRDALDVAEAAVEAARLSGNPQFTSWALVAEGWTAAMSGDLVRARTAAEEAVDLLGVLDESVLTRSARVTSAVIFLEAGDSGRCLEEARRAGAPALDHLEAGRRAWLAAALARAELARGSDAGAESWLARAARELHGLELPLARAGVLHARALLALERGDAPAAAQFAGRAAALADAVGAGIQAGRSRALAGRALARAGDRPGALVALTRAEAELTACGAHRLRDEAARELRRLGRRTPARQRRSGRGQLSGRQREIAELVAQGRSNREIAAELFLAEKTVEGHLSTIFAKLEVSSRAGVAAAVARGDADSG